MYYNTKIAHKNNLVNAFVLQNQENFNRAVLKRKIGIRNTGKY